MASVILTAAATGLTAGATTGVAFAATTGAALLGAYLDNKIFAADDTKGYNRGTRLSDVQLSGSTVNTVVPRLFGRAKIGGNVFWATEFNETINTTTQSQVTENKKDSQTHTTENTDFNYSQSAAIGICEGPIHGILRVWINGDEWIPTADEIEIFTGEVDQDASDIIKAIHKDLDDSYRKEDDPVDCKRPYDEADFPAYPGLAYMVVKKMPLKFHGNKFPTMEFEVMKRPRDLESPEDDRDLWGDPDSLMIDLNGGEFSLLDKILIQNEEQIYG